MMHAYDENLLYKAQITLANMLDTAVYVYDYELSAFYFLFLNSEYSKRFEKGESSVIAGMSGREMAYAVINANQNIEMKKPVYYVDRSREYWVGWSLGFYQWYSGKGFREINDFVDINTVLSMYQKYHEMDIMHFVDCLDRMSESQKESAFKRLRMYANLSQKELAERTGIPLRTIQQYEQGQKDLSHARADSVIKIAKALYCRVEDLI